jgi:hypothetical protein
MRQIGKIETQIINGQIKIENQIMDGQKKIAEEEAMQEQRTSQIKADLIKTVQKEDSKVDEASIDSAIKAIKSKMAVSSEALANTNDMEKSKEYLALIKDCADCIQALKNCNQ